MSIGFERIVSTRQHDNDAADDAAAADDDDAVVDVVAYAADGLG
jgi:hypothetical protein